MAPLLLLLLLAGDPTPLTTPDAADQVAAQPPARADLAIDLEEPPAPEPTPVPAAPTVTEPPKPAEPPKPPAVAPPPPHTGVKATLKAIPKDFTHLPTGINFGILGVGGVMALGAHA
ncbi:MAG TPA: hypothetical protein VGN09_15260, partial [Vicinamibacteria bacterium]